MRIVSHNTNFCKSGHAFSHALFVSAPDVLLFQRVSQEDMPLIGIPNDYQYHWHGDMELSSGIACVWKRSLAAEIIPVTLTHGMQMPDRYQGNHAMTLSFGHLTLINCLPCYHDETLSVDDWVWHVQTCINLGAWRHSFIIGDFHQQDRDMEWNLIDLHGFVNHSAHLNTFTNGYGHMANLDKVFAKPQHGIKRISHVVEPYLTDQWGVHGIHWPLMIEIS